MGFFKAYDMRGTYGVDFDCDTVRKVGLALPKVVGGTRWLVGRDCRKSSDEVRAALVDGLLDAGADVTDIGLCTTPMVYWFTGSDGYDGSVMVTASHNPPSDNGLKVSKRLAMPVGYADGLNRVEELVKSPGFCGPDCPSRSRGSLNCPDDVRERYLAAMRTLSGGVDFSGLRFAVDCSNGMSALFAEKLFPGAMVLNGTIDGTFPAHSPNPLKEDARAELVRAVLDNGLDFGIIFDGDADRAMFVDERGAFVQPDYLIPVVAKATGIGTVVHDVRTSRGAIEVLGEMGCSPLMVPVGHAFAKPVLRREGATCGGELAGHYYFREFHCCDSGILAAIRIIGEIAAAKSRGKAFSRMMAPICGRYANSGELNFRVEDKDAAIGRVLAKAAECLPPERSRSTMDGIRIEYGEGWLNIRKSNTEPYLRLIVECDLQSRMEDWVGTIREAIGE